MTLLDDAEPVAVDACLAGGRYLRGAYQDGTSEVTHSTVDAKSTADVSAEERMLAVLEESFPDHTVEAEESGVPPGDDRYRWVVDGVVRERLLEDGEHALLGIGVGGGFRVDRRVGHLRGAVPIGAAEVPPAGQAGVDRNWFGVVEEGHGFDPRPASGKPVTIDGGSRPVTG